MPRNVLAALLFLACTASLAGQWWDDREEGWFWYNELNDGERETITTEEPVGVPVAEVETFTSDIVPHGPAIFSSAWLRQNLDGYLETAIDDPTPENVQAFLYLQRLSLDRAERFSDAVSLAVVADPVLDETTRSPIAPFAANQTPSLVAQRRARLLDKIASRAGIFFFFESTCPYCQAQAPVLVRLAQTHGFNVYAISVDGYPLPGGEFPDFRVDQGTAAQLGVLNYPAMFLAAPPDTYVNVTQGAVSLLELEERIVQAALMVGLITDEAFQEMRMRPVQTLAEISASGDDELTNDPTALVLRMRRQLGFNW